MAASIRQGAFWRRSGLLSIGNYTKRRILNFTRYTNILGFRKSLSTSTPLQEKVRASVQYFITSVHGVYFYLLFTLFMG